MELPNVLPFDALPPDRVMKNSELVKLIKIAYDHVGKLGRDAARIYVAVVELDGQVRMWKKRALDLGWTVDTVPTPEPASE